MQPQLLLVVLAGALVEGIYFPGFTPLSYREGVAIPIKVNSLTSVQNIMPYEWYHLPFCKDEKLTHAKQQNIGEILWGDKVEMSMYSVEMLWNVTCRVLCKKQYTEKQLKQFQTRIEQRYKGNMLLDGLPVAEEGTGKVSPMNAAVSIGFPLGVPRNNQQGKTFMHNHLAFRISYHTQPTETMTGEATKSYRIVGFQVTPYSIDHDDNPCDPNFNVDKEGTKPLPTTKNEVTWSYSVRWVEDPTIDWYTRWDVYLKSSSNEARIHWFAIINSLLVVMFLTLIVAIILMRALHKDFNRYNDPANAEEAADETGWKQVHADVFRPPPYAALLAVYVGTGAQLLLMSLCTLLFALFGLLSPANRGALLSALIFLFVLLGSYAGYTASRLLTMFGLRQWMYIFATGLFFPGQIFGMWFVLNLIMWAYDSASAVPFRTILTLMSLWLGVSLVLVLLGAVVGFKRPPIEAVCKINKVPRVVPPQPWYLQAPQAILLPGLLPFGAAFIESVFILSSIWQGRVYYVFGFLTLVFIILIVTCAETTIVMIYFQLVREDHQWWWRSFLISGSYAWWFYLYCIYYYSSSLPITSFSSSVLYFGYMAMVSYFCFVLTGTIGFMAAFLFVRKIYSSIKVD